MYFTSSEIQPTTPRQFKISNYENLTREVLFLKKKTNYKK